MSPDDEAIFDLGSLAAPARAVERLHDRGWNVRAGDLDFPMMVLKNSAVQNNIAVMAEYCAANGVELSPHGKTTMMPWLIDQQLAAGAWGMTAATPAHCKTYRRFGVPRILLANVLIDAQAIQWLARELRDPDFDFMCYVDSIDGAEILAEQLERASTPRPVDVLVEVGYLGGRTGTRTLDDAVALARHVDGHAHLNLRGVSGFEGFFRSDDPNRVSDECRAYLRHVRTVATAIHDAGVVTTEPFVVSAGGSAYFDAVVDTMAPREFHFPVQTILRSGCYVSHDAEMYEPTSPLAARSAAGDAGRLAAALELWATVWSRPEPELAIVGFGRRDAPYDYRLPVAQRICARGDRSFRPVNAAYEVTALHDQHAFVRVPAADPLAVGDQVLFGVSHPCGAFDSWPWMPVVDDDYDVLLGVRTYF